MKVGIIVHSHTGNTLSVAERMKEQLSATGHTVSLERVEAVNEEPNAALTTELKTAPDTTGYDILIFGAPVRGFSLSPVMLKYLNQLPVYEGKKICCYVTQQLPFPWMGGKRAIRQMTELLKNKGAVIFDTGIVNWSNKKRENLIVDVIGRLCKV